MENRADAIIDVSVIIMIDFLTRFLKFVYYFFLYLMIV